ncbi:hypothetical protein G7Y79_00012g032890 [Physcia stellaris]|nr:hypothetical protein G7Y79_00012g032890 [Physcia stellaris]
METLDCTYGGLIVYQNLPSDDLGGINSLYSSQYLAQRDTDFLRLHIPANIHGSEMLYKVYRSAIQQRYWPELVDVRDTTATWLVTCPGPDHDNALTAARIIVALDARWSIVGLLSFGDFGIVLKGRLTDAQVVDLERWVFPTALLRIGNPTALFRERTSSSINQSTELVVPLNQSNLPSAPTVVEASTTNRSASATSRRVTEGPLPSNNNNDNGHSYHPTTWLQPQTSPAEDDSDDISDDSDDSDSLSSSASSDEDEEPLPSYRHASRRLARERRLLAQDPSEVEDPAEGAVPSSDVVAEEADFEVPPTYHNRGEGVPDYTEVTGNNGGRDESHTDAQAPHSQGSPPSYLLLPVISEGVFPDYETMIQLDNPTTTAALRQEASNSSHTSAGMFHGSLLATTSASEPRPTQGRPPNYGPSMASDTLPMYPSANPPIYQPSFSPLALPQNQNQNQNEIPPPASLSLTAPTIPTPVRLPLALPSPPQPPPYSIHRTPNPQLSIGTIRTPISGPFPPTTQRLDFEDMDTWPPLRQVRLLRPPTAPLPSLEATESVEQSR